MNNNTDVVARLEVLESALGLSEPLQLRARLEELSAERETLVAEKAPLLEAANAMRAKVEVARVAIVQAQSAHRRLQGLSGAAANALALATDQIRQVDDEVEEAQARLQELARASQAPVVRSLVGR